MRSALALIAIAAGVLPAASHAQANSSPADQYRAIVALYRGGQGKDAVHRLLQMNRPEVGELVERAVSPSSRGTLAGRPVDTAFLRAAAMLHAEAAFQCWTRGPIREGGKQLDLGRLLIDASSPPGDRSDLFRRSWYLSTSLVASALVIPEEAIGLFDRALKTLPTDAVLLTAAGWYAERVSTRAAHDRAGPDEHRVWATRFREAAERYLTRALQAAPSDPGIALRLARINVLAGDDRQARERLTTLLARGDLEPPIGYVARLLLGGIHERAGDGAAAESVYREAIALHTRAQSARLALGAVLYARGSAGAGADLVERAVDPSDVSTDPWAEYQLVHVRLGWPLFEELRKEVQR